MKAPEDIEVELSKLKKTYVGQHLLHTIYNSLTIPNVTYDWKKGIQLLRHVNSRKRSYLFQDEKKKYKQNFAREEEDVADLLCAAQMKDLLGEKSNTRMDSHLKDVKAHQRRIFDMMEGSPNTKVDPLPENSFTVSSSQKLLAEIKQNTEELEKTFSKTLRRSNHSIRNSQEIEKD